MASWSVGYVVSWLVTQLAVLVTCFVDYLVSWLVGQLVMLLAALLTRRDLCAKIGHVSWLVAPVTVHALRRSRFLVPPYSSLNDLGGRQSYSPDACAGAGDGAGAGILENDNHGAAAGAGIMETDNHIAKARGRVARRAVGYLTHIRS